MVKRDITANNNTIYRYLYAIKKLKSDDHTKSIIKYTSIVRF